MNVDHFLDRVVLMVQNFGDYDAGYITRTCLLDIGMPCHMDGYKYIAYGAALRHKNPDAMITKDIYPAIAKAFGCTTMQVEVSFRRAIDTAWNNRNENWTNYFSEERKPSNDEFLSVMYEFLDFWEACKENINKDETTRAPLGLG